MSTQLLGKQGEKEAKRYLIKNGYKIIKMNYRKPFGEIDIIAIEPDKTLTFVEVKATFNKNPEIQSEEHFTFAKYKKLKKVIEVFIQTQHFTEYVNRYNCRLDLLALTITENSCEVRHYKNIFF
ncbi:MAG: YraN family protein [bacterium]